MKTVFGKLFRLFFPAQNAASVKREYHLPENIHFSLRVTPEGWFSVSMPDQPGLITQANSHQSLVEMINDAVLTYYDVPKRKADIVYDRLKIGDDIVRYEGELQTKPA